MTHKLYINAYFIISLHFLWIILAFELFKMRRGAQFKTQHSILKNHSVAHPGARTWCHALPWWALCCLLSSRTTAAWNKKNTLIMIIRSRRWSRTVAKAVPGAGWGVSWLINTYDIISCRLFIYTLRCTLLHRSRYMRYESCPTPIWPPYRCRTR